jgi:hypothetical protein
MKTVTLASFLTPAELQWVCSRYVCLRGTGTFAAIIDRDLLTPNLARIDAALGQPNDARFLAYLIESVLADATERGLSFQA